MARFLGFDIVRAKKAEQAPPPVEKAVPPVSPSNLPVDLQLDEGNPYSLGNSDYVNLFWLLPEIAYPVNYIVSRIKNARFVLKRYEDDSEVWSDAGRKLYGDEKLASDFVKDFLAKPNFYQTFHQFVEQTFLQKYLAGSAFIYDPSHIEGVPKWKTSRNFHVIPSSSVEVYASRMRPVIMAQSVGDMTESYRITSSGRTYRVEPGSVLFIRDIPVLKDGEDIKGYSRLRTQQKCIDNLLEVYMARFAIYNKRGAIGALVNQDKDADSAIPLSPDEKNAILDEFNKKYGVTHSRMPFVILDKPMGYMSLAASISELQPFDETYLDAAQIAGIFNVKKELIPRKDNSTFANQESAEISAYNDMVIPETKNLASDLTEYLSLSEAGLYLDADFNDVEVLKKTKNEGVKAEQVKVSLEVGKFKAGLCTLNDVLGACGMEAVDGSLYNKTILEMGPEEIAVLENVKII